MKRQTVFALLSAVALLATACGGSDSDGEASLPDVSTPTVAPPVTEPGSAGTEPAPADAPTDELAGDEVVFVWAETGGCAMGGPNCARYEISVNGTVRTYRATGTDDTVEPAATGQIDPTLVQAWREALAAEDLDALRARVGEGEMTAAFDGVDYLVSNPVAGVELSSVATSFDRTEAVFASAIALADAAAEVAPLELEMR